mmetsp:Transcript_103854/g.260471  ORF Transcript_103854/g.260471 Transcript_103854/m.260471 type:complete len:222 (+) Transcript_103854:1236-1901(+)
MRRVVGVWVHARVDLNFELLAEAILARAAGFGEVVREQHHGYIDGCGICADLCCGFFDEGEKQGSGAPARVPIAQVHILCWTEFVRVGTRIRDKVVTHMDRVTAAARKVGGESILVCHLHVPNFHASLVGRIERGPHEHEHGIRALIIAPANSSCLILHIGVWVLARVRTEVVANSDPVCATRQGRSGDPFLRRHGHVVLGQHQLRGARVRGALHRRELRH